MVSEESLFNGSNVVLMDAQRKHRGCTNSDVTRGLVQRIMDNPEGFDSEIVLFKNEGDWGSLDCDMMRWGRYLDTGIHANAEEDTPSLSSLVDTVFANPRISKHLLNPIWQPVISKEEEANLVRVWR